MPYIHKAYTFYKKFILDYTREKAQIYKEYGFSQQGSIGSKDWEVFAAILFDDQAKPGYGSDLMHYEVKSAMVGAAFEYQYHRLHGREKLENDKQVDHLFIARDSSYSNVEVWLVNRAALMPIFEQWMPALIENYAGDQKQRFRRSISFGFVKSNGRQILEIKDEQLIESR